MLGVVIGVGFVILLVSLGSGARAEITEGIQGMGSNLIIVVPFKIELDVSTNMMQQGAPQFAVNRMSPETAEEIGRAIGRPEDVGMGVRRSFYVSNGRRRYFGLVSGTTSNEFELRDLETESGRFFTPAEADSGGRSSVTRTPLAGTW